MNILFFILIALAYLTTLWNQLVWERVTPDALSPMQLLSNSIFSSAQDAVVLSIGLIGVMAFFLGLMKVAEDAGLLKILAKLMQPLMCRLFPEIPSDHSAQGAIIMNFSANLLGLGNAATPFGIKAMQALDSLNPAKGTATNAMVLFLTINTSSLTLLPTKVIALRTAAGSHDPTGIVATTLFATICSTIVAIIATKSLQRFFKIPHTAPLSTNDKPTENYPSNPAPLKAYSTWVSILAISIFISIIPLTIFYGKQFSPWIIPSIVFAIFLLGIIKKINIYETFTEGAKEGFATAVRIIPYLVAILVAIAMLRASGTLDWIVHALGTITIKFGLPPEAVPMALMRPLSGSGSLGVLASIINDPTIGPDSYIGYLVSTMMGSTETTFYVIAVYFGAIQIKRLRHTVPAALLADLAGMIASVFIVWVMFG